MPERVLVVLPPDGSWLPAFRASARSGGPALIFVNAGYDELASLAADVSARGVVVCADALGEYSDVPDLGLATIFLGGREGQFPQEVRPDGSIGRLVATAFADAGRTRIALIGPHASSAARAEVASFLKAVVVHDLQLPRSLIVETANDSEGAAEELRRRLDATGQPPQAIFCTSVGAALGAHDVFTGLGLDVPDDVSIVTISHEEPFSHSGRNLITVCPDTAAMVGMALDRLLRGREAGRADEPPAPYRATNGKRESQVMRALAGLLNKSSV